MAAIKCIAILISILFEFNSILFFSSSISFLFIWALIFGNTFPSSCVRLNVLSVCVSVFDLPSRTPPWLWTNLKIDRSMQTVMQNIDDSKQTKKQLIWYIFQKEFVTKNGWMPKDENEQKRYPHNFVPFFFYFSLSLFLSLSFSLSRSFISFLHCKYR